MANRISSSIYEECITHHAAMEAEGSVVKPSIPVPYFGDVTSYFNSPIRAITVGLNPSDREFLDRGKIVQRFDVSAMTPNTLERTLCNYFRKDPYRSWFNSFEVILNGMDATYGFPDKTKKNISLHVDAASPIATATKWSKLSREVSDKLVNVGRVIFRRLLVELQPHLVIASVARSHIDALDADFISLEPWSEFTRYDHDESGREFKSPVVIRAKEIDVGGGARALWVNGAAAQTPYGKLTSLRKAELGVRLLEEIRSRDILKARQISQCQSGG